MPHQIKLATCCYCGRRTALRPTARGGHELACGACGAPLHIMKAMPIASNSEARPKSSNPKVSPGFSPSTQKRKPAKKRKPLWRRAIEEAWDIAEDIFD
jgi:hypothetical protein